MSAFARLNRIPQLNVQRPIIVLTLGLTAISAALLSAQKLSFEVGPVAGIVFSDWHVPDVRGPTASRRGFVGGGFLTMRISTYLAFEAQLLYVRKGTDFRGSYTATYKQDYIEIPVLIRGTYPLAGVRFASTIFAGPAVAFQTSCTFSSTSFSGPGYQILAITIPCDSVWSKSTNASMTHSDALLVFGGGLNVGPFALLARYDLGLTKLITQGTTPQDYKTKAWLLSVGFGMTLGKR